MGLISISDKLADAFKRGAGENSPPDTGTPANQATLAWQALALFALALLVRLLGNASLPVHRDEFFHFLAAQSWADNGSLAILDGAYPRASSYTVLTGLGFLLFDQSGLFVARLPALLAGALLVPAVFVWARRRISPRAAWIAALLVCFADLMIEVSQFTRFYTLQALFVWIGSAAVYSALHDRKSIGTATVWLATAGACFLSALHLQVTTIIHLAGIGLYLAAYAVSRPRISSFLAQQRYRLWLIGGAAALLAAVIAIAPRLPFDEFRDTSYWAREHRDDVLYYVRIFLDRFLILTLIFPLSIWLAVSRRSRAGLFCLTLFGTAFVAHSLAGMKSFRYIIYALPFFFVLIAIAFDFLLSALSPVVVSMLKRAEDMRWIRIADRSRPIVTVTILVLGTFLAIAGNRAYAHTLKRIVIDTHRVILNPSSFAQEPPDRSWRAAAPRLRAAIGTPSLFVVADDMRTVHYLGPFDLLISRSRVSDISPPVEFGTDFRTGRRVVGSGETLAEVAACYPDGVILAPADRWELDSAVPPDVKAAIHAFAVPVTPGVDGFHLFRWRHPVHGVRCQDIRAMIEDHSPR
ncbi:hypothetical protein [Novosphingobium endophyticum]|uniref:hypothetical protein n=1 Tax=Novosphingobium endophyticum TaxID=1955250 RepID=UPI001665BE84|nr:hypothetical protein [Novosphingobium endophyticum]